MLITYVWFTTLIFVFCFVITALVMAHNNDVSDTGNKSDGFAAIWTMLLIIALSIGGTMVMRKYQTPLAVGFFLGVCVMMSVNMFSLFVLFLGAAYIEGHAAEDVARSEDVRDEAASTEASDKAIATFCFFLCLLYGIFSVLLARFRNHIVKEVALGSLADQRGSTAPSSAPEDDKPAVSV